MDPKRIESIIRKLLSMGVLLWSSLACAEGDLSGLKTLSLEALSNMQVSIASRTEQALDDAAAAVFVITAEDIRRSGANSIPEALRMVPGLNVARIDANTWAVSARGFNGRYANKLLVLMDGRSVYSPLFSGVHWGELDSIIEDIDRIEVIRGPGASVWGANAVNGVINIITRSAQNSLGSEANLAIGERGQRTFSLRHGGSLNADMDYRVWFKARRHRAGRLFSGDMGFDAGKDLRAGFRIDGLLANDDSVTLIGNAYTQRAGKVFVRPDLLSGVVQDEENNQNQGVSLLGRWTHLRADGAEGTVQLYYDYQRREETRESRYTVDLDFHYLFPRLGRHSITLGAGYRWMSDDIGARPLQYELDPPHLDYGLYNLFVQDDIALNDRWALVLGAKLEHNDFSGFEFQPSVRLLWHPAPRQTLWLALSRASRTPNRSETGLRAGVSVVPAAPPLVPLPVLARGVGTTAFDSERLTAYELGYRRRFGASLSIDTVFFYNEYSGLRTLGFGRFNDEHVPDYLIYETFFGNEGEGSSHGAELAADWRPAPRWRMQFAWSWLRTDLLVPNPDVDASLTGSGGGSPRHQLSLRGGYDLSHAIALDAWLRYVGELSDSGGVAIPAYWSLDARIGWRLDNGLSLSLVARNLLDAAHPEYSDKLDTVVATEVPRTLWLKVRWDF